ncbi:MAG: ribosomal protein S18-alanine N-acetyltransferase [Clostridia bacterium]|nr:ribosomal protein S18-alanine N-acetyltransferase [Clostridia bacterium]
MAEIRISAFSAEHIKAAAKIEAQTFSEPWSEESLKLLTTEAYPSFAISEGDELLAYVGTSRVLDELQILTVATANSARRRGFGRAILKALDEYAKDNAIALISLEVRESNTAAIELYRKAGYSVAGVRRGFYRFPTEDALVMIKNFDN